MNVRERMTHSFVWQTLFVAERSELNRRHIAFHSATFLAVLLGLLALGQVPATRMISGAFVLSFIWSRSGRRLLLDFGPFLALILAYEWTRAYADDFSPSAIHVSDVISWEKALFGGVVPAHYLQQHLWGQPCTPLCDGLANFFYILHPFSPFILALLLWFYRYDRFWAYMAGILVLSYAAFATYLFFPAAPPWWATYYGYLSDQPVTLDHFIVGVDEMMRYADRANFVAAMPSLHVGYPVLIALVSVDVWGKRVWPIIFLPLAVTFAIVYLGHHYVIDALAGAAYAWAVFVLVYRRVARHWTG